MTDYPNIAISNFRDHYHHYITYYDRLSHFQASNHWTSAVNRRTTVRLQEKLSAENPFRRSRMRHGAEMEGSTAEVFMLNIKPKFMFSFTHLCLGNPDV